MDTSTADTEPMGLDPVPRPAQAAQGALPASLQELQQALSRPEGPRARHLGEALIERGIIDPAILQAALARQRQLTPHRLLGQLLVDGGTITPLQLNGALASWMGVPLVDPRRLVPEPEALARLPRALAEREQVLALMQHEDALVVAMSDPWDQALLEQLRFAAEQRVLPVMALPGTLPAALSAAYRVPAGGHDGGDPTASEVALLARALSEEGQADVDIDPAVLNQSDNPLVRLVNAMIADAVRLRASDIHIESGEGQPVRVRLRIDGELAPYLELPQRLRFALVARLKIMADLDIAERRKPQDGKIAFARFGGARVELRMVTVPTLHGLEDVVLRILSGLKPMPIESIGLSAPVLAGLRSAMDKPYGLVLICGPTGCGKTTTLHSVLRELNTAKRKIWTAEDPVEITQAGLRQVQVNPRIGWTFAAAMRTFLRADPDVIMIGEMRDAETARIAVEASLTGHLVLSTLHTNSAPESITRLLEIGLDPFMFSDSLLAILAQRLVRRLCTRCREARPLDDGALRALAQQYAESSGGRGATMDALIERWRRQHGDAQGRLLMHHRRGCEACDHTGYRGRLGLHELMVASDSTRHLVRHRAAADALQAAALDAGMITLRQDGIEKVLAGLTDMAEVLTASNA
ncbi:GspE/PulE family protein [Aquabacterium sp.]|uniref:GspE/PulE family protein n=1 Tax=Aquabacterium sp. TaxID=1872578 RepID=UPI0037842E3E